MILFDTSEHLRWNVWKEALKRLDRQQIFSQKVYVDGAMSLQELKYAGGVDIA